MGIWWIIQQMKKEKLGAEPYNICNFYIDKKS